LKDDVAFTLLTTIYLHMIATFNEIDNIFVLDAILNGEPIGLGNILVNNMVLILGKVVVEEIIDQSSRVRWNLPLNATYVNCGVASILYKIDIYTTIWANKLFPLKVCHN